MATEAIILRMHAADLLRAAVLVRSVNRSLVELAVADLDELDRVQIALYRLSRKLAQLETRGDPQ